MGLATPIYIADSAAPDGKAAINSITEPVTGFTQMIRGDRGTTHREVYKRVQRYGECFSRYLKLMELLAVAVIGKKFKARGNIGYYVRLARVPVSCINNLQKWLNYRFYIGDSDDCGSQRALKRICPKFLLFSGVNGLALYGAEIAELFGLKLSPSILSGWKLWSGRFGQVGTASACGLMLSAAINGFYTAKTYTAWKPADGSKAQDFDEAENKAQLHSKLNKRRHDAFKQVLDGVKYGGETMVPWAPTEEAEQALNLVSRLAAAAKSTYDVISEDLVPVR